MLHEFLEHCAQIPYNSAARDLPPTYNDADTWGLDCVEFARRTQDVFPDAVTIRGWYKGNSIHVATVVGDQYVDPFLRMKQPALISTQRQTVPSFFHETHVHVQFDPDTDHLHVWETRDRFHRNEYHYYLNQQDIGNPPIGGYYFMLLDNGYPVTIQKHKMIRSTASVVVKGADVEYAQQLLQNRLNISLEDIGQMFYDAGQNNRYANYFSDEG